MSGRIRIEPVAVGAVTGRAAVGKVVEGNLGATGISENPDGAITLRRLDDVLGSDVGCVTLLKIDVEGTEPQVLAGAVMTIQKSHPLIVAEAGTESEAQVIDDILFPYGYHREPDNLAATPTYLWR
jgi:FkbM family methyltransferase